jgi:hypothetical protein
MANGELKRHVIASISKHDIDDILQKCEALQELWEEACEEKSQDEKGLSFLLINLASMSQTDIGNLVIALHAENIALRGAIARVQIQAYDSMEICERIRHDHAKRLLRSEYAGKLQNLRLREDLELQQHKDRIQAQRQKEIEDYDVETAARNMEVLTKLLTTFQASQRAQKCKQNRLHMPNIHIRLPWKTWLRNVQSHARVLQYFRRQHRTSQYDIEVEHHGFARNEVEGVENHRFDSLDSYETNVSVVYPYTSSISFQEDKDDDRKEEPSPVSSLDISSASEWGSVAQVDGSNEEEDNLERVSHSSSIFSSFSADLGW